MSDFVQGEELGEGRYVVARRLEAGVYLVRPQSGEASCLARDLGPVEGLQELRQWVDRMKQWSHPRLAGVLDLLEQGGHGYLVVERPEGVNLATLLSYRTDPVEDSTLVKWGRQLSEALAFLEGQGWPVPESCLRLDLLTVSPSEDLTVTFFGAAEGSQEPRAEGTPAGRAQVQLVRLLVELAGGSPQEALTAADMDRLPPELAYAGSRARAAGFPTLEALREAVLGESGTLEQVAAPERIATGQRRPGPVEVVLRQPLRRLALEAAVLLMAVAGLFVWMSRPPPLRRQAVVYVASGDRLVSVDPVSLQLLGRVDLKSRAVSLAASEDGLWLFASAEDAPHIEVVNTLTGLQVGEVGLQQPATRLAVAGTRLLASQPQARLLTMLAFPGEPPPKDWSADLRLRPSGFVATGSDEFHFLALPDRLVLAEGGSLVLHELAPVRVTGRRELPGPVEALAASPGGGLLAVGGGGSVSIFDSASLQAVAGLELESPDPLGQLLFAPGERRVWALTREGRVTVLSLDTGEVLHRLWLDAPPGRAAFVGEELWIPLPATGEVALVAAETGSLREGLRIAPGPQAVLPLPAPRPSAADS